MRSRTDNPERATTREVDIHTGECGHTGSLNVQNVVRAFQWIALAVESKGEVWESRHLGAIDCILAVPRPLGTNLGVEHLSHIGGERNQGSAFQTGMVSMAQCL